MQGKKGLMIGHNSACNKCLENYTGRVCFSVEPSMSVRSVTFGVVSRGMKTGIGVNNTEILCDSPLKKWMFRI